MSDFYRQSIIKNGKVMPQLFKRAAESKGNLFNKFNPKRGFSSGNRGDRFNNLLENLVSKLPGGNVGILIAALNTFCYLMYLMWPRHQMYSYLNNFTFSKFNLNQGRLHTFFTSHFTHMSFLSYLLDTVIIYLFCQNLSMMFGPVFVVKNILLSMFMGSFLLFLQHQSSGGMLRPYYGSDAILRGLIFTIIFQNPSASFYLLPLPIQIPAWAIAAVLLGLDFLSFNVAAFGGVSASYLMVNYFI
eukprot:403365427